MEREKSREHPCQRQHSPAGLPEQHDARNGRDERRQERPREARRMAPDAGRGEAGDAACDQQPAEQDRDFEVRIGLHRHELALGDDPVICDAQAHEKRQENGACAQHEEGRALPQKEPPMRLERMLGGARQSFDRAGAFLGHAPPPWQQEISPSGRLPRYGARGAKITRRFASRFLSGCSTGTPDMTTGAAAPRPPGQTPASPAAGLDNKGGSPRRAGTRVASTHTRTPVGQSRLHLRFRQIREAEARERRVQRQGDPVEHELALDADLRLSQPPFWNSHAYRPP